MDIRRLFIGFFALVLFSSTSVSSLHADVDGNGPSGTQANSVDEPYVSGSIRFCVLNFSSIQLDSNSIAAQVYSWLTDSARGYTGITSVGWINANPVCADPDIKIEFHNEGAFPPNVVGNWPNIPSGESSWTWGPTRSDGKQHLLRGALRMNADWWTHQDTTPTDREFAIRHEVGHAIGINHEGPVLSPVAFGKAPWTNCPSPNCLASWYDTADYDDTEYDPITNTGTIGDKVTATVANTDKDMVQSYYADRAAQPIHTCLGNPSPGVLRATSVDTTRFNISQYAYLYRWNGSAWQYDQGSFVSLTHSPAFGERLQVDFNIGTSTGFYIVGMFSYKQSTGWNQTDPINWSPYIYVSSYNNNDVHPPCTPIPTKFDGTDNLAYLDWIESSQNIDYVRLEFRAVDGYDKVSGGAIPPWTFVTNVNAPTSEVWHWFPSNPPDNMRFVYQLIAVGPGGQSQPSGWVLVQPNPL